MSCSMNKLKSHILFIFKNFMFSEFTWKKNLLQEMVGEGGLIPHDLPSPIFYVPVLSLT